MSRSGVLRLADWPLSPLVGIGAIAVGLAATRHLTAAVAVALGAVVLWIAREDYRSFTIPDAALAAFGLLALAERGLEAWRAGEPAGEAAALAAVDALLPFLLLFLVREAYFRRRGFDGLGFGDVKLAAAGGLLVGLSGFSWALLAASAAGIGILLLKQRAAGGPFDPSAKLAFGTLLAPLLWLVWLVERLPALAPPLGV